MKVNERQNLKIDRGFNLIELMISAVLGLVLVGIVIQSLFAGYTNRNLSLHVQAMQYDGSMAQETLRHVLYHAGFEGCKPSVNISLISGVTTQLASSMTQVIDGGTQAFPVDTFANSGAISVFDRDMMGNYSPALTGQIAIELNAASPQPRNGSSVIGIYHTSVEFATVTTPMTSPTADIELDRDIGFSPNDYVLIADCSKSSVFKMKKLYRNKIQYSGNLGTLYLAGAEARHAYYDFYYIGETGQLNSSKEKIYGLFRLRNGKTDEIARNIHFIELSYGEKNADDTLSYHNSFSLISNPKNIKQLSIGFMVISKNPIMTSPDTQSYQLISTVDPTDPRLAGYEKHLKEAFKFDINLINGI